MDAAKAIDAAVDAASILAALESAWDRTGNDYIIVSGSVAKYIRRSMGLRGMPKRRGARGRKFALMWQTPPR